MSKPNQLIDAVKTATDIHNGDYSSLRGKFFLIHDKIRKKNHHSGDKSVKKTKINQLEGRIDKLDERMGRLEESIANLTEEMRNGFKQVNSRIGNLEKDVKDINARIDRIDARLDYNGLKKLPESR